jgi:L-arabinose isomerase
MFRSVGRTISQADLIETIKTSSSAWIKKQGNAYRSFFWQRGYGAFSVGFSQLDGLIHLMQVGGDYLMNSMSRRMSHGA